MPASRTKKTQAKAAVATTSTTATSPDAGAAVQDEVVFFWRTSHVNGWASQWYPSQFTATVEIDEGVAEEVVFPTAEHWMMLQKALVFGDKDIARSVLKITGASHSEMQQVKALGRKVTPFDESVWRQKREEIVLAGTVHKFRQNETLMEKLFATGEREIAESSPRDKIWGIGMGENKAVGVGREKWAGLNLLGKALVRARTVLRDEFGEVPEKDREIPN